MCINNKYLSNQGGETVMATVQIEKPVFYRNEEGRLLQLLSYSTDSKSWGVFDVIRGSQIPNIQNIDYNKVTFDFNNFENNEDAINYISQIVVEKELVLA
jgi:hypothetical protein